jgi:hypothetical protein
MIIKRKSARLLALAALVLAGAGIVAADQLDPATKARVDSFDKGAATINVSGYPQGIQEDYGVFSQKCAQCHKLSRPINSDYALPDDWSHYIKRMMYKPGSGISGGDAKKIYDFLVYDSSVRKKSLLNSKLKALSSADQATQQQKIQEVVSRYK